MEYTWTIEDLQALSASSVQLTYNVDAPDSLSFVLMPDKYNELPLKKHDRLTLTDGGRVVFSGLVPMGGNYATQAAHGERIDVELLSDYYILEHTVFAKMGYKGNVIYARNPVGKNTSSLLAVTSSVREWLGDYFPSQLDCDIDTRIPTPVSNGTSPCSALLADGMRWVPDAVAVQRYDEAGNTVRITKPGSLEEPLVFNPDIHPLQEVSLQARHDLQVPVCALVGGVHQVWPQGADVRALGAFVYAVPVQRDSEDEQTLGGAGESPASSKMVVRGVHLPENLKYEVDPEEFRMKPVASLPNTVRFIKAVFPEYAPFIPWLQAGHTIVNVTSEEDFLEAMNPGPEEEAKIPKNYSAQPETWSADGRAVYVHTEGSFAASPDGRKNLRGLKWCKASMSVVLAVQLNETPVPQNLWNLGMQLFPGRRKSGGNRYGYVRKTLSCNLINKRKTEYDPATNKLCSTDPDYQAELDKLPEDDAPQAPDYVAAMAQYYEAASKLMHEGSISLLHDGSLNPAALTGRKVTVEGMRAEWASMNTVVRSVQWNVADKKLALSLGTRASLGFDEYLERRLIARNRGRDEAQRAAIAYDTQDPVAQEENEQAMPVSPSIAAGTDKESDGRWHRPFSLYIKEDDNTGKVVLRGGEIKRGKDTFTVEDSETQIKDGAPSDEPWLYGLKVKLRWKTKNGALTFDIYQ